MKSSFLTLFLLAAFCLASAQTGSNSLVLKDILEGKYSPRGSEEMRPTSDPEYFTRLSSDRKAVLKCAYRTGATVDTLFHADRARETHLDKIDGYEINSTGTRILVYTDSESIYRRSWKARFYEYDTRRNYLKPLTEQDGKIMFPTFSPDGRMCAFVRDNNIFLKKFDYDTESQITKDGEAGKIINGATDWVYEEEFSTAKLMSWSADSRFLAFVKTDESQVPLYRFQEFDGSLYPGFYSYKYPKPGENNSVVAVYAYDTEAKTTRKMEVPLDADGYIPEIRFTENIDQLAVMTLNRHQNRFDLYFANPKSTVCKLILRDEDKYYIDSDWIRDIRFTKDKFLYVSEKSGFSHIYLYSINGVLQKQLTSGDWDVTAFYGYNAVTGTAYFQAAAESPLRREVYKVDEKGVKTKLSTQAGNNSAAFGGGFKYFTNRFSNAETPSVITLCDANGKTVRTIADNAALADLLKTVSLPKKEFFTFKIPSGETLNGWIIKPADFEPSRQYPLLMVQYSGPDSQTVLDRYEMDWCNYLANQGFIIAAVDGRGTGARGAEFRKQTYLKLGIMESDDQAAAAKYLGSQPFIDASRIAIWGWSFGGYNVLMSLSRGGGVFKAGVAIAPVTDWRFYDSVYTERFMRTPQENESGYNAASPLALAGNLQGKLLLIHGTADDNVHFQNTMYYARRLEDLGKQFDMQIYPDKNHSILGRETRRHLYTRVIDFLEENL
ncbi:MAG: S9 family peptidase [Dysgonamonadaceae bacterium]|jgi:dipeptidyl-peptidase-4|nr:S9 family peptidase [Dysgonamonadaceae bacterium]